MAQIVMGLFTDKDTASAAINDLEKSGYNPKDLSVIMKDEEGRQEIANDTGANVAEGATTGATTGAVIGGIAGLLIGIGAIAIPGIGGLLIGGPIAAALGLTGAAGTTVSGAVTGALAGGLIGALTGLGVPEEEARVYEERVKSGAILLAVPIRGDNEIEVQGILREHSADEVKVFNLHDETP